MDVQVSVKIMDGEEVLFDLSKRTIFDEHPYYDRMLHTHIAGLNKEVKDELRKQEFIKEMTVKRRAVEDKRVYEYEDFGNHQSG